MRTRNTRPTKTAAAPITLAMFLLLSLAQPGAAALRLNGFLIDDPLVPAGQILPGGPPRDGIPSLDTPRFRDARSATAPRPDERVLGLQIDGQAHAYPIAIMNWHEIVNDRIGDIPVTITYCPLCGSGVAFSRRLQDKVLDFGVSGLLYNSDVLLYDRQTGSLWSQILGQAISGPLKGQRLTRIPLEHSHWQRWRQQHPQTRVLSRQTGYRRDYDRDPYAAYRRHRRTLFPVAHHSNRLHPKEEVVTLSIGGQHKAWPFSELARGHSPLTDQLGDQRLRIEYDAKNRHARIYSSVDGRRLPSMISYWFAWYAFHPDTRLYRFPGDRHDD